MLRRQFRWAFANLRRFASDLVGLKPRLAEDNGKMRLKPHTFVSRAASYLRVVRRARIAAGLL